MTIYEYLKARFRKALVLMFTGYIPALLFVFLAPQGDLAPSKDVLHLISLCIICASFTACVVMVLRTPCPRCALPLGTVAWRVGCGQSSGIARCPHCGVRFDAPIDRMHK
jgi:hypothetical protein